MRTRKDGTFSRADFRYEKDRNIYTRPAGKTLKTTGRVHDGKTVLYRAPKADGQQCPLKQRCCPRTPVRKVPRDVNEAARDVARSLVGTPAFERSWDDRKKVEMRFGQRSQVMK